MSKLYISQEEYDELISDSRTVTGPYIAVDAYVTGTMSAAEAIELGNIWFRLQKAEKKNYPLKYLDEFVRYAGEHRISIHVPVSSNGVYQLTAILRKYIIDQIYQIEEDHD